MTVHSCHVGIAAYTLAIAIACTVGFWLLACAFAVLLVGELIELPLACAREEAERQNLAELARFRRLQNSRGFSGIDQETPNDSAISRRVS